MKHVRKIALLALMGGLFAMPAKAEVVISGASCLPEGSYFSQRFENFVADLNERGKGVVQINYVGGAPAIGDPFSVGLRIARGAYDIGNCTGAYYQSALPITGMRPGWETVTKYRVDPGFYEVDFQILVNAKVWDSMPAEARDLIQKVALEHEAKAGEQDAADVVASRKQQVEEFGFEIITFEGEEAKTWLKAARDAGWAGIAAINAEQAAALRPLFAND